MLDFMKIKMQQSFSGKEETERERERKKIKRVRHKIPENARGVA